MVLDPSKKKLCKKKEKGNQQAERKKQRSAYRRPLTKQMQDAYR